MEKNSDNEKIEKILKDVIMPDMFNLLSKDYTLDTEILDALDKLEAKWSALDMPEEYSKSFDMLVNSKYSKEDIYKILPYCHIYIFVMKMITYLFFQNSQFDTELSMISTLNHICLDRAENYELAEYVIEHISYVQDIALARDEEKAAVIKAAMEENAAGFIKACS